MMLTLAERSVASLNLNFTSSSFRLAPLTCPPMVTSKNTIGLFGFVGWTFIVAIMETKQYLIILDTLLLHPCEQFENKTVVDVLRWPVLPKTRVERKDKSNLRLSRFRRTTLQKLNKHYKNKLQELQNKNAKKTPKNVESV